MLTGQTQNESERKLSICIVAHNAYGALSGAHQGHIGGIEWQTSLMSRWLQARGHNVSVITWQEGLPDDETIDGIRIIKICRQDSGIPKLRFFHPRWTSLSRALRKADAEVYYHCGAEAFTGQIAYWCRRHGRRFVFSVASDADCDAPSRFFRSRFEWWHYEFGLKNADSVVTQSHQQASKLMANFERESVVVPMPCLPPAAYLSVRDCNHGLRVLWVGRICEVKRPDRLLNLARLCPNVDFDLVGPFGPNKYSQAIRVEAEDIPNVKVHGRKSKDQMDAIYQQSSVLCCTSEIEGFPNTFLEAWSNGRPVITTFDPDNVVSENRLGMAVQTEAEIKIVLISLFNNRSLLLELGDNARRYYLKYHKPEAILPRMESILLGQS